MQGQNMDDEYKPYTARRWTDIPRPIVVGYDDTPPTPEEQAENERSFTRILRKYGVITSEEEVRNSEIVKVDGTGKPEDKGKANEQYQ